MSLDIFSLRTLSLSNSEIKLYLVSRILYLSIMLSFSASHSICFCSNWCPIWIFSHYPLWIHSLHISSFSSIFRIFADKSFSNWILFSVSFEMSSFKRLTTSSYIDWEFPQKIKIFYVVLPLLFKVGIYVIIFVFIFSTFVFTRDFLDFSHISNIFYSLSIRSWSFVMVWVAPKSSLLWISTGFSLYSLDHIVRGKLLFGHFYEVKW